MQKNKKNVLIRQKAKEAGVYLWEIAQELGISEPTMNRKLRTEFNSEDTACVLSAIEQIVRKREEN